MFLACSEILANSTKPENLKRKIPNDCFLFFFLNQHNIVKAPETHHILSSVLFFSYVYRHLHGIVLAVPSRGFPIYTPKLSYGDFTPTRFWCRLERCCLKIFNWNRVAIFHSVAINMSPFRCVCVCVCVGKGWFALDWMDSMMLSLSPHVLAVIYDRECFAPAASMREMESEHCSLWLFDTTQFISICDMFAWWVRMCGTVFLRAACHPFNGAHNGGNGKAMSNYIWIVCVFGVLEVVYSRVCIRHSQAECDIFYSQLSGN